MLLCFRLTGSDVFPAFPLGGILRSVVSRALLMHRAIPWYVYNQGAEQRGGGQSAERGHAGSRGGVVVVRTGVGWGMGRPGALVAAGRHGEMRTKRTAGGSLLCRRTPSRSACARGRSTAGRSQSGRRAAGRGDRYISQPTTQLVRVDGAPETACFAILSRCGENST